MEYTQNYALRKPGLNEYANVGDLNFNADKIDSQMKKNQDVDGEVYDPTSTSSNAYEAGDYVINPDDGLMYVCNGTTYGTWDATKWDHTTEFEELQKAMASGGESELADLHDVEITNPTDGQALLYDDTTDKWHNSDLPDADVTKEASGNPIEFTDGADAPLVKCVTEIQGSQDLHGQDKPWVGGAGKNKLPLVLADIKSLNTTGTWSGSSYTVNGVTFTIITDNYGNVTGIKVNGTATETIYFKLAQGLSFLGTFNGTYTATGAQNGGNDTTYAFQVYSDVGGIYINVYGAIDYDVKSDSTPTANIDSAYITIRSGYTASNLMFYPMIRLTSVTDPTFAPYSNICPITAYTEGEIEVSDGDGNTTTHTTTYPSAIYRGSEDVVNGEVESEYVFADFINADWSPSSPENHVFRGVLTSIVRDSIDISALTSLCNKYAAMSWADISSSDNGKYSYAVPANRLVIVDHRFSTTADFIASLSDIQLVLKLTTPTTSSVTPTNLPIKSLSGYNHIESSTGEMEIEYFPAKEQPLIDLIPEASNMHEYSTAEQVVGKWVDGKDVYEKTYVFSSLPIVNDWTAFDEDCGIDTLVDYSLMFTRENGQIDNDSDVLRVAYNPPTGLGDLCYYPGGVGVTHITVRYTKTASNNRSLKSAPQEETKEEQVEELKEEPTEEIKDEPTEEVEEEPEEVKEEPVEEVKEEVKEEETKDPETNEEEKR